MEVVPAKECDVHVPTSSRDVRRLCSSRWLLRTAVTASTAFLLQPAQAADVITNSTGATATMTLAELQEENERLKNEIELLKVHTTTLAPTVVDHLAHHLGTVGGTVTALATGNLSNIPIVEDKTNATPSPLEEIELVGVICCLAVFSLLPVVYPFQRSCATKLHRVYPCILVIDVAALIFAVNMLHTISINTGFFILVGIMEFVISKVEFVLSGLTFVIFALIGWKFKDRVLEALGIDNPMTYIGECRDWFTCWSMKRFEPIEFLIWKVEGVPGGLTGNNDLYVEVLYGYNFNMRTRVHHRAGSGCTFKETFQLNYDPQDTDKLMHIHVMSQAAIALNPDPICKVSLGTQQVNRFRKTLESQRTLGWRGSQHSASDWADADAKFLALDLIPAGKIWVKIADVEDPEGDSSCCCWPSAKPKPPPSYSPMPMTQMAEMP